MSSSHIRRQVYHPVRQTGKRITLVGWITADGFFLRHRTVISGRNDLDLPFIGITNENVAVYSQAKGYTDQPIFFAWLTDLFLPEVTWTRKMSGYTGNTVLIMRSCAVHTGPDLEEACAEPGAVIYPRPSHGSNQIRPLDLPTFGTRKPDRMHQPHGVGERSIQPYCSGCEHLYVGRVAPKHRSNVCDFRAAISPDEKLLCRVCSQQAKCLFNPIEGVAESVPTDEEIEEIEKESNFNYYPEIVIEAMPNSEIG
jgi:hypothetical protein